jgi:hypothetical protein
MQQLLFLLSDNPAMQMMQLSLLILGVLAVFLVCFATRDIILRTHSLLYQLGCVLLVACLPIVGFFLYLLVRPARTVKERELFEAVRILLERRQEGAIPPEPAPHEAASEETPIPSVTVPTE